MYDVWLCDLENVIKAFRKACPDIELFSSINGNANGDFIIEYGSDTYLIKHTDFSVWHFVGDWINGKWEKVE